MSSFVNDEIGNMINLCTGLNLSYSPQIILGDNKNIGELFYDMRCSLLHEAIVPCNVKFDDNLDGIIFKTEMIGGKPIITISERFCYSLLFVLIGCPEYTSISPEYVGRKIRFGGHEVLPSQCVGNFEELLRQIRVKK